MSNHVTLRSPTYINVVKLRPRVETTGCQSVPGGWEALGTIHNSGRLSHDFRLTVYFTTASATVLSSATSSVPVKAGSSGSWAVTSRFVAAPVVRCVLVGVG